MTQEKNHISEEIINTKFNLEHRSYYFETKEVKLQFKKLKLCNENLDY